ncbi:MAG: nucleoside recognition protein, partial [Lachnospiraceae bacterium]|nr:nucleoside recognition protein [Lachnospiraceae bacterium]
ATPAGLKAMEDLAQLEEKRRQTGYLKNVPKDTASNEMCTFLILNISSLQLIPVNMIAYRSQYGSASPAAVVGPAVLATLVSTLAAVIFCRGMDRR